MKVLVISDLHGKSIWKILVNGAEFDKIIFLGDYVDCFNYAVINRMVQELNNLEKLIQDTQDIVYKLYLEKNIISIREAISMMTRNFVSDDDIVKNIEEIIEFKQNKKDKVILLMGNHDLSYLENFNFYGCSGHNVDLEPKLTPIFTKNKDLFSAAYAPNNNFLFTHGGINSVFTENYKYPNTPIEIAARLNQEIIDLKSNAHILGVFNNSSFNDKLAGPFWQRPSALSKNTSLPFWQIVGHTEFKGIVVNIENKIAYTDCLNYGTQYLVLEDDCLQIGNI